MPHNKNVNAAQLTEFHDGCRPYFLCMQTILFERMLSIIWSFDFQNLQSQNWQKMDSQFFQIPVYPSKKTQIYILLKQKYQITAIFTRLAKIS